MLARETIRIIESSVDSSGNSSATSRSGGADTNIACINAELPPELNTIEFAPSGETSSVLERITKEKLEISELESAYVAMQAELRYNSLY